MHTCVPAHTPVHAKITSIIYGGLCLFVVFFKCIRKNNCLRRPENSSLPLEKLISASEAPEVPSLVTHCFACFWWPDILVAAIKGKCSWGQLTTFTGVRLFGTTLTKTFSEVCVYAHTPKPTQQLEPSVHSWVPQFFGFCPVLHAVHFIFFNCRLNNDFYRRQWFGYRKLNQLYVVKNEKDRKEEIVVRGKKKGFLGQQDGPVGE